LQSDQLFQLCQHSAAVLIDLSVFVYRLLMQQKFSLLAIGMPSTHQDGQTDISHLLRNIHEPRKSMARCCASPLISLDWASRDRTRNHHHWGSFPYDSTNKASYGMQDRSVTREQRCSKDHMGMSQQHRTGRSYPRGSPPPQDARIHMKNHVGKHPARS